MVVLQRPSLGRKRSVAGSKTPALRTREKGFPRGLEIENRRRLKTGRFSRLIGSNPVRVGELVVGVVISSQLLPLSNILASEKSVILATADIWGL